MKERFGVELEPEVQTLGPVSFPATGHGHEQRPRAVRRRGALTPAAAAAPPAAARAAARWPRSLAILALAAGGLAVAAHSSLVAVKRVTVVGVSGRDARQIRAALTAAAHNMTTLDVKMSALRTAVAPYPVVKHLHVSTDFPHRMRIRSPSRCRWR